jgi:hypothetical protein
VGRFHYSTQPAAGKHAQGLEVASPTIIDQDAQAPEQDQATLERELAFADKHLERTSRRIERREKA